MPSASLVEPGAPVSVTSPIESQVPERIAMPVPATTSRARNPKIAVKNCSGTTNAMMINPSV